MHLGTEETSHPLPHLCPSTAVTWALSDVHCGVCSQFLFILHWGTIISALSSLTECPKTKHGLTSYNVWKWNKNVVSFAPVWHKRKNPYPSLWLGHSNLVKCHSVPYHLRWCVRSCSPCGAKNYVEMINGLKIIKVRFSISPSPTIVHFPSA